MSTVEVGAGLLRFVGFAPTIRGALPPEHPIYALIGRVMVLTTHWEHLLDLIIWEIEGRPVVGGPQMDARPDRRCGLGGS